MQFCICFNDMIFKLNRIKSEFNQSYLNRNVFEIPQMQFAKQIRKQI